MKNSIIPILAVTICVLSCEKEGNTPIAEFTSSANTVMVGDSILFSDQSTDNPTSWLWDFGNGRSSIEQNPIFIYTALGSYTVSLEARNDEGANIKTKDNYINVEAITLTDYNSNNYKTTTIGTQVWMAENLKAIHFPDGTEIPLVQSNAAWGALVNNDTEAAYALWPGKEYGPVYTYAAAKDACPTGWHLPSNEEWIMLENYLADNGYNYDGTTGGGSLKIAKAMAATTSWNTSDSVGAIGNDLSLNNASGFSGLAGGLRDYTNGSFVYNKTYAIFWTSTEFNGAQVYFKNLACHYPDLFSNYFYKSSGFYVRCVKD